VSYTAGIDKSQIRFFGWFDFLESELFEQLSNLLAFILIDFAAKSIYGKVFMEKVFILWYNLYLLERIYKVN